MNKLATLLGAIGMLMAGAAAQASECTTVMSPINPGQNSDDVLQARRSQQHQRKHQRLALLSKRVMRQIGSKSNER